MSTHAVTGFLEVLVYYLNRLALYLFLEMRKCESAILSCYSRIIGGWLVKLTSRHYNWHAPRH